jgi:hypothetical protein
MTGKPSCPVRREAARNRTRPRRAPHRAADPTAWLHQFKRLRIRYERRADIHPGLLELAAQSSASDGF